MSTITKTVVIIDDHNKQERTVEVGLVMWKGKYVPVAFQPKYPVHSVNAVYMDKDGPHLSKVSIGLPVDVAAGRTMDTINVATCELNVWAVLNGTTAEELQKRVELRNW